jgi:hypothetical protein
MIGTLRTVPALLAFTALIAAPMSAQAQPAPSVDDVSADNDILTTLNRYGFAVDQLNKLIPILKTVEEKRQALEAYKHSDEALQPLLALREAQLKGSPTKELTDAAQPVFTQVEALEGELEDVVPAATDEITKLLTDEQLALATQANDLAAQETDLLLGDLEGARDFDQARFDTWRDQQAADFAKRLAPQEPAKAAQLQKGLRDFMDKVRKLSADDYIKQSDELFEELHTLIAGASAPPTRDVAEDQAKQELEFVVRSPRTLPLIEAMLKARA